MVSEDFDYRYDSKDIKGLSRERRRNSKQTRKPKEVLGVYKNPEGRQMARIHYKLTHGEWPKDENEAGEHADRLTAGHSQSIEPAYRDSVASKYGENYRNMSPWQIEKIIVEDDEKKMLSESAARWEGTMVHAEPQRDGKLKLSLPLLDLELKVKATDTVAQVQKRMYIQLLGEDDYRFTSRDPRDEFIGIFDSAEHLKKFEENGN